MESSTTSSRILVVEDARANIEMLVALLRQQCYQLNVATNGRAALEALQRVRPDLILLDVLMPEMDGFETCRRLKQTPAWRDIPVIFLTAKSETGDIVRGFELGAVDYVAKPFNAHELLARVHTHLTLDRLNRENQRLLLNVLPAPIADKLRKVPGIIADRFEDVSVLFADIVDFTALSTRLSAVKVVDLLNRVFSAFDEMAEAYGLEKIKTIGDAYMVAGGLPEPHPDHLAAMARMALAMLANVHQREAELGGLNLRLGLHVGSVVAGVIGTRKFSYDIWGDTVNTASRLELHGVPGRVHVSDAVYARLRDRFSFVARGSVDLKGRGPMDTYFLEGEPAQPAAER
jgi:class 3 adenylate cyclase